MCKQCHLQAYRVSVSSPAVTAEDLTVVYGDKAALDGLNLSIAPGVIHAILGPNGAGKTTFIRVATTLLTPTSGSIHVLGRNVVTDAAAVRDLIGVAGQYATIDEVLTGEENLLLTGTLYGLPANERRARAGDLLSRFDLTDAARRPARTYSGGMRRRLDLAASLMGNPEVLFLDEPTTGLDVRTRNALWEEVRAIADRGVTVVLTTQYLEEADALASRISIIDTGRVVAEGTPQELKSTVGEEILSLQPADERALSDLADAVGGEIRGQHVRVATAKDGINSILATALGVGPLASVTTSTASLDDVFLSYTGHAPEEEALPEPTKRRRRRSS
jgi:daunorubicin resistance ABC transporter ATP-binding subunit